MPNPDDIRFGEELVAQGKLDRAVFKDMVRQVEEAEQNGQNISLRALIEKAVAVEEKEEEEISLETIVLADNLEESDASMKVGEEKEPANEDSEAGYEETSKIDVQTERGDNNDALIGQEIDEYRIERKLGAGGMATVYLATSPDGEHVAFKLMRGDVLDAAENMLQRLTREATILSSLSHENIVSVIGSGVAPQGHYIVMEFVDGESLRDRIAQQGRIPPKETAEIAIQVARGLSAAEAQRIIHRDLKPGNILISRSGQAKIVDFGLARHVDMTISITKPGTILGTVYYMSPEQCDGEALDNRSDLYSLGATLYRAVTGIYPFRGETPFAVMLKHKNEKLVPPHIAHPQVPEPLSLIICRLMAKAPEDRYQHADELIEDLEAFLQNRPLVHAEKPTAFPSPSVRALLAVEHGPLQRLRFPLGDSDVQTIGRDSNRSDIVLLDPSISRLHCSIRRTPTGWRIYDAGSTNGVVVDGKLTPTADLGPDSQIELGDTRLRFMIMPTADDVIQMARLAAEKSLISEVQAMECLQDYAARELAGQPMSLAEIMQKKAGVNPADLEKLKRDVDRQLMSLNAAAPIEKRETDDNQTAEKCEEKVSVGVHSKEAEKAHSEIAAVMRARGVFDDIVFCDGCGSYITNHEIESRTYRRVGNYLFCSNCSQSNPLLGRRIRRYILLDLIAEGTWGTTLRAEVVGTRRVVAVKIIAPQYAGDSGFMDRLQECVERVSTLRLPQAISPIDCGLEDGIGFVAFPYAGPSTIGRSLIRTQEDGSLTFRKTYDVERAVHVCCQVAEVLASVHSARVRHGELSPSKFVIDEAGEICVLDIGLPTTYLLGRVPPLQLKSGWISFQFFSDPALQGDASNATEKSDIWSLGAILYTLVTGEFLRVPEGVKVAPPETKAELPDNIQRIIHRATAGSAWRRFRDMAAFAQELKKTLY